MKVTVGEMAPRLQSSGCGLITFSISGVGTGVVTSAAVVGTGATLVACGAIDIAGVAVDSAGALVGVARLFDPPQAASAAMAMSNPHTVKIRLSMSLLTDIMALKRGRLYHKGRDKGWGPKRNYQ